MKKVLQEALLVALAGTAFAFAANALSPLGLRLTRNYFPGDKHTAQPTLAAGVGVPGTAGTNGHVLSTADLAVARLKDKGLQVIAGKEVETLFHDPRFQQGLLIFIDARDDHHYQQGHIPGAYQFDHYHPESYLGPLLPACQAAQQIIVYCNGGECEDSEFATVRLRDEMGVAREKLYIYAGGIKEWEQKSLPVESGSRNSGKLRGATP